MMIIIILIYFHPYSCIVRRWADKFCLHCNIFIYIRHIWIKPVLCSRMVSLCHHTSPRTHRCLQSSPSAHRRGRVFRRSVQTVCCYWILNGRKSSSNWNSQTNASRLWWSVCWCEYSKTLGKAVQRWRTGASRFEWRNTERKVCDCKWLALSRSRWRTDPRKSSYQTKWNCRCIRNFEGESVGHIIGVLGFRKFVPDGYRAWWNESWKIVK